MRNLLLNAAALALLATPGVANAGGGYIDAYGGNDEITLAGPTADSSMWGADGVFGFSNGQVGAHYASFDEGNTDDMWEVDGHLFMRNESWQLGAGVAYDDFNGGDFTEWAVAAEGLWFLDRATLGASATYSTSDEFGAEADFWGLDAEARYFATDNFSVGVTAGWGNFDIGIADDDMTTYGANAEWKFGDAPVSLFAGYSHSEVNIFLDPFETQAWALGARWNFGGQSLIERDRNGPNLRAPAGGVSRLFGL